LSEGTKEKNGENEELQTLYVPPPCSTLFSAALNMATKNDLKEGGSKERAEDEREQTGNDGIETIRVTAREIKQKRY
jgi:hypothetical protein